MRNDVVCLVGENARNAELEGCDAEVGTEETHAVAFGEGGNEHAGCGECLMEADEWATDLIPVGEVGGGICENRSNDSRRRREQLTHRSRIPQSVMKNDRQEICVCVTWQSGSHQHDRPHIQLRILKVVKHDLEGNLVLFAVAAIAVNALDGDETVAVVEEFGFCRKVDDDEPAKAAEDDRYGALDDEDPAPTVQSCLALQESQAVGEDGGKTSRYH